MKIYRVTRVIRHNPENYILEEGKEYPWCKYSIQLNNEIWINNIDPKFAYNNKSYRINYIKLLCSFELDNVSIKDIQNGGLMALSGNYIYCSIKKNGKWNNFQDILCLDLVKASTIELDKFSDKIHEISYEIPLYDFLVLKGYQKQIDGSISSKKKERTCVIKVGKKEFLYLKADKAVEPYLQLKRTDILTFYNIDKIYENLYENTEVADHLVDKNDGTQYTYKKCRYYKGIYIETERWSTSMSMYKKDRCIKTEVDFIQLGDKLPKECSSYLSNIPDTKICSNCSYRQKRYRSDTEYQCLNGQNLIDGRYLEISQMNHTCEHYKSDLYLEVGFERADWNS